MLLTLAEIETLKLIAWCKDIPVVSPFTAKETLSSLLGTGLIRKSKSGLSFRVTNEGLLLLKKLGYNYPTDSQSRGVGPIMTRRLRTAQLMLFLTRLDTDVYLRYPAPKSQSNAFLPSFVYRRDKNKNPLATSRFCGVLYGSEYAIAVYSLGKENDGLYPSTEKNTFTMKILTGDRKSAVLFTGEENIDALISNSFNKTTLSRALCVMDAAKQLDCPVAFVPMNEDGLRQIRIILSSGYRQRFANILLKSDYEPPDKFWYDAKQKVSGEKIMIGFDLDFPRMQIAADYGVHIFLLDWQIECVKKMLMGKKAILHSISVKTAEDILKLPYNLTQKEIKPYITTKGEYVVATFKDN